MERTHDLLLELEENDISRLKIKLLRYFQSKKSNGGECDVDHTEGDRTAVLRFRREQDQKGVLAKGSHQITVGNCVLNMTVRLPTDGATVQETSSHEVTQKPDDVPVPKGQTDARGGNNETAAEGIRSSSAVLGNIPENSKQDYLELLVENIFRGGDSSSGCPAFTFEFLPDIASAVLTFQSVKDAADFVTRCPQHSRFKKMGLSVQLLGITQQVLVEDPENIGEDFMTLYFENVGGEVESFVVSEVDRSAIVTFKEPEAAQKILKKKKHTISQKEFKVFAFHKSLGTALFGEERPQVNLPHAITQSIECAIGEYLNANQSAAESIHRDLKEQYCIVNLEQSTVSFSPVAKLRQQKDAKAIASQWKESVEATFAQSLSKYRCLKLSPEADAWEESEKMIRKVLLGEDVVVVPDKAKGVVSVAGPAAVVDRVEPVLSEATNKIKKQMQRQKSSVTQAIKMSPAVYSIMFQGDLKEQLHSMSPELKISYGKDGQELIMTGIMEEIEEVKKNILVQTFQLKKEKLEMDGFVLDFLKEEEEQELADAFLASYGIQAALKICGSGMQLVAFTEGALRQAKDHLEKLLISQYVDVEDVNVLMMPEWNRQVQRSANANNRLPSKIRIHTADQRVVVSGKKDVVINVSRELEDFLKQHAKVEDMVVIKAASILKYVKEYYQSEMEKLQDNVDLSYNTAAIHLNGSRANVTRCKSQVEKLVSSVFFEAFNISFAGGKKLFKNYDITGSLLSETGCLVEILDQTSAGHFVREQHKAHCATPSQSPPPVAAPTTSTSPRNQTPSNPKILGQVQTKEGLNITLVVGNIEDATTDVIVNSVSSDLDLKRGVLSEAILKAAGPEVQQALNEKQSGTSGDVHMTEGFMLKCKFIYHAVAPLWHQPEPQKILSGIFMNCLNMAEDSGMSSISFPSLGTGRLNFPKDLAAQLLFDEISKFSQKRQTNALMEVTIILYSGNKETQRVFSEKLKENFGKTEESKKKSKKHTASGHFSKVIVSPGMCEAKMGSVTIQAVTGDITKETTEVIINSSNDKFSLKTGVSKAILEAAGQEVEDECQKLAASPNAGIIMTGPGHLECKNIIHLAGRNKGPEIHNMVKSSLQMCVANSFTSVSFPALGTGQGNVKVSEVADAMFDAVIDVLSQSSSTPLTTVRIVIFQPPMLKDFQISMQKREATVSKPSIFGSAFSSLKAFFYSSTDKPQKEDFLIKSMEVEPLCFHICGKSQAAIDSAKKKITDLISKERTTMSISDDAILSLSPADHQSINDIQATLSVKITAEKSNTPSLTIEGLCNDVLTASIEIQAMLKRVREEGYQKEKADLVGKMAIWQYQQGTVFQNFDSINNCKLEEAHKRNVPSVDVTIQGQLYTVLMPSGPATDSQGNSLQIKRADKDENIPSNWEIMPVNTSCHTVTLAAGTEEYQKVQDLFQATCKQTIITIDRIQNPILWKGLQNHKGYMDQKNGHQNNEKTLFHGTTEETVPIINKCGFNRSYAGKNAACFGNGTYFAVNAVYSARDKYSKPNQNGEKHMYLCRVLTGDYTTGKENMVSPPCKSPNSTEQYDSTVNNPANPEIFVVFHDNQAYPEYLIKFK